MAPSPPMVLVGRKSKLAARLFAVFGIDIDLVLDHATNEVLAFEDAKLKAKRNYKRLALKKHPDHGGSAADFRKLNEAHTELQSLVYQSRREEPDNMLGIVITVNTGTRGTVKVTTVHPRRRKK